MNLATFNAAHVTMATPGNGSGAVSCSSEAARTFVFVSEAVLIPVILCLGIISNCFSLMILPRASIAPAFKTCLLALTLSDLCAGAVGFVQMMVEVLVFRGQIEWGRWNRWAVTSFSLYYIFSLFLCTSSAIVIAIVAIRHYTISKPVSAKMNITSRSAKVICVLLWVLTLVIFLPTTLMVLWQSCHKETSVWVCMKVNQAVPNLRQIALTYLLMVTILYGPILVIIYVCCMIGIRMNLEKTEQILENLQEVNPVSKNERRSRRKNTMKITKTLLLILLLDTICCLPLVVQAFAMVIAPRKTVFSTTNNEYKVFDAIAELFLVSRQAYNFWLYAFSHKSFRLRAKTLFFCMCVPKYRLMWKSPTSNSIHQGRLDRLSSANSSRLRSVDFDTDATWVRVNELRGGEDGRGRKDSRRSEDSVNTESMLNGEEKIIIHTTKL